MYWNLFDTKNLSKGASSILDTLDLYTFAEDRNISVDDFRSSSKSFVVELEEDTYAIAIDESQVTTQAEMKVCLAHELGHCETASFYNIDNHLDLMSRHEARANRWAIKKLVSKDELEDAVCNGYTEIWELAEYFDLPQDFMVKVVCYYEGNQ